MLVEIMAGRAGDAQTAAVLGALRVKGETAAEIVGMARAMTALAEKVEVDADVILDTCGTGGDGAGTFNISTAAALVAAGAGVHGRQARQPLGDQQVRQRRRAGGARRAHRPRRRSGEPLPRASAASASCSRPRHHPAMKHVGAGAPRARHPHDLQPHRPAHQPGRARRHQLIGVSDARYVDRIAEAVRLMGTARNLVVHCDDGLDEITTTGPTERASRCSPARGSTSATR